jgi:phage replication-related protein YjqB (UPF0714/DUF867 family)
MDKYSCFAELTHYENDFELDFCDRKSPVTILAPHGGRIEPHTTAIARLIAGKNYNYFCFNGKKEGCNNDLHITSHRYDAKQALQLVKKSLTVITVHGCTRDEPILFLGGLDANLKNRIAAELTTTNITISQLSSVYGGKHKNNICNRGLSGKGVQLECSRPLRNSQNNRLTLARAIRRALDSSLRGS